MNPVDAHCHLDFDRFDGDREKVIRRADEQLEFVVNAGRDPVSNRASLKLERENQNVVANLGLHPTHTDSFEELEEVKHQVRENDPAAIGEIGLDHHHVTEGETRKRQEEVFREMLALAEETGKPVVVHTRDAEQKSVEILEEFEIEAMLHCFNGSLELAQRAVEKGWKIGITTQVLYSGRVQELAENLPVEALMLETDAPFLYRGERNEPANVKESAAEIAGLKGVEVEKIVEETTGKARQLFR